MLITEGTWSWRVVMIIPNNWLKPIG